MKPRTTRLPVQAFTLLELIMVMIITGILGSAGIGAALTVSSALTSNQRINQLTNSARFINQRMAVDLRQAKRHTLLVASSDRIELTNIAGTKISYFKTDNQLFRQENTDTPFLLTDKLSSDSNAFTFTYLKADGITTTTVLTDIRYINLDFTLEQGEDTHATGISYRLLIFVRNP